ncbi:WD-repeat protein, putative [Pediculus humanus corporis]|uniref:WD-repeat protein, putative n=1 Tax=Pediculus humanus subsp. corporis TaxID=121224 RepID=E0VPQ2_PEDHC|nr:WD-repeat protein, putative [Pediculus humanus corporis]EEB15358.1 WD-repeat protein, putative [Pediculus humanus corporis]
MKHSRNEILKYNVGSYMKRRHYSDNENFKKSDLVLLKTVSHLTLSSVVENESSHANSILYSCINNDPSVAESQFLKLKNWINELTNTTVKNELKELLFPLLCHLYIEMLRGGHKNAAGTFLKKNQSISTEEEAILMLEELASIESTKDIEEKDIVQNLRSSKYSLTLSSTSIEILKQYLVRHSHIILLQMINCWFDFEEKKTQDANVIESEENEVINQPCNGYPEIQQSDGDLAKLEEIIKLVNEVPSTSGPLLLYSVYNPDNSITCGQISEDTLYLAAGLSTSELQLWSLTENKRLSKKPCSSSKIRLAVDIDDSTVETESKNISEPVSSITLRSHSGRVQDLAFIPNNDLLLSVSMDKTMRAWDLKSYSCRAVYRGHNYPIWAIDVSPLGVYVATGSHDKTARLWSLERNYPLRIFAGHVQDVDCLRFHPNGSYLATGSSDKSVRLWSTSSGELMRVLPGHRGGIYALSFSPNGKLLASAGEDRRIKIWDIASSNVITELKGHSGTITSLDWSPNGDFLASCSFDNTCRIWNVKNCSSSDEHSALQPEIHNLTCNSLFSVKYSKRNTPICVAGVYLIVEKNC